MRCPKCHTSIITPAAFCYVCGQPLQHQNSTPILPPTTVHPASYSPSPLLHDKPRPFKGLSVTCIILSGLYGVYMFTLLFTNVYYLFTNIYTFVHHGGYSSEIILSFFSRQLLLTIIYFTGCFAAIFGILSGVSSLRERYRGRQGLLPAAICSMTLFLALIEIAFRFIDFLRIRNSFAIRNESLIFYIVTLIMGSFYWLFFVLKRPARAAPSFHTTVPPPMYGNNIPPPKGPV